MCVWVWGKINCRSLRYYEVIWLCVVWPGFLFVFFFHWASPFSPFSHLSSPFCLAFSSIAVVHRVYCEHVNRKGKHFPLLSLHACFEWSCWFVPLNPSLPALELITSAMKDDRLFGWRWFFITNNHLVSRLHKLLTIVRWEDKSWGRGKGVRILPNVSLFDCESDGTTFVLLSWTENRIQVYSEMDRIQTKDPDVHPLFHTLSPS